MSNAAGKKARREEEIAFLAMEQVLDVEIKLADAGAGDKKPDGSWLYPDDQTRRAIVEIKLAASRAPDSRMGRREEGGATPEREWMDPGPIG